MRALIEKYFIPYIVPGMLMGTGFVCMTMATSELRHKYISWKWDKIREQERQACKFQTNEILDK